MANYEATANQKALAAIGRDMITFSEDFPNLKGLDDADMAQLNEISDVGAMLTTYGTIWGAKAKEITPRHLRLIDDFMNGRLSTQAINE